MMIRLRHQQPGQSIVILALFATILFAFMGLGIDGSLLYLQRRQLQNVADAACLAAATDISLGNAATAEQTAKTYIVNNLSENAKAAFVLPSPLSTTNVVDPKIGTSTGLVRGVEITGSDVRVAVTFPAYTYFMQLVGFETYNVMARARCDSTKGGSIWPVGIVRFPGYEQNDERYSGSPNVNTAAPLPQYYTKGKNTLPLRVRDILQAETKTNSGILNEGPVDAAAGCDSKFRQWYDWPSLGNPTASPPTGIFAEACPPASPSAPGYEVPMLGGNANSNVGDAAFSGPLVLDIRQVSFPTKLYYNDVMTRANKPGADSWKDLTALYLMKPYPGPDVLPGQEIAVLEGVSVGQMIIPVEKRYKVGDEVWAIIYNGQVYNKPDFELVVTCVKGQGPVANTADPKTGPFATCNNEKTPGKFVYRDAPPEYESGALFNASCTSFNGDYFIGDPADFDTSSPAIQPAKYEVVVRPPTGGKPENAAGLTIQLSARLTGANNGAGGAGSPGDFGDLQVRWTYVDAAGTKKVSGWQSPSKLVTVPMLLDAKDAKGNWLGVTVTLEVAQRATKEVDCYKTTDLTKTTPIKMTVPERVAGSHHIQIFGRAVETSRQHSDYASLGMKYCNAASTDCDTIASTTAYPEDFFLSFVEPNALAVNDTDYTGTKAIEAPLSFVGAEDGKDVAVGKISSSQVIWRNEDGTVCGVASCNGMSATLDNSGKSPTLMISVPKGQATGEYDIDVQLTSTRTHSTRLRLRVENRNNSSIDSWIVSLCYGRFRLTDMNGKNQTIMGRAISGCVPPSQVTQGFASRLLPW